MEIHFESALAPEDEYRLAEAVVASAAALLDQWPIAYALSVETDFGRIERRSDGIPGVAQVGHDIHARH